MTAVLSKAFAQVRRVVGYVKSSESDTTAVYGKRPNKNDDDGNVSGNIAANTIGGWH